MKIKHLIVFILFTTNFLKAQSYFGYLNDNYAGVHSVLYNPANIVDSRFNTDINLISGSGFIGNDLYATKLSNIFNNSFDFERDGTRTLKDNNNFITNIDVLGPSFMFNFNNKNSLAFFTRGRSINHFSSINGKALDDINNDINTSYRVDNQNFSLASNLWAEFGFSYARIFMDKGQHFLKAGFSAKYLSGFLTGYIKATNLSVAYNFTGNVNTNTTTTSGEIESGNLKSLDNLDNVIENRGNGFGGDIGFTYEYRPDYESYQYTNKEGGKSYFKDKNKYKFRLQLSITDLGSIKYNDATTTRYNANTTYPDSQVNTDFDVLYTKIEETKSINFSLPTAMHLNADWKMNRTLYLNFNTDVSLINPENKNSAYINNNVSLTPRFEVKWFSIYTPITYLQYSGLQAGLGFRAGPLFVGSGSIVSGLLSETKALDVHLGLKIPVYQGKIKDIDFDGLKDSEDNCPEIAGPIENKGCPWGDADKDGLTDNIDKCPKEFGPKENNGCPWTDKDGDKVLDKDDNCPNEVGAIENKGCPWGDADKDGLTDNIDKCPNEFGPKENNGCPYTDKDGDKVLDKDDNCPDVAGTIENKGCPEVKIDNKVIKKLNDYSKSVLFDTGKSTIKADSFITLDAMAEIMKEYVDTNFSIEGHTDNAGKPESNLKLSAERALAIKTYLIEKGIAESRLKSDGFGSKKPIADNKTKTGKTLNRRVEIKVIE
jgi:outer membrane protein OmpA-like peptidoglycan-associated protein